MNLVDPAISRLIDRLAGKKAANQSAPAGPVKTCKAGNLPAARKTLGLSLKQNLGGWADRTGFALFIHLLTLLLAVHGGAADKEGRFRGKSFHEVAKALQVCPLIFAGSSPPGADAMDEKIRRGIQ